MIGWRARLGFLVPPGNPTVETEMIELTPQAVSLHFHRMMARGIGGALDGQRERNQMMIDHLPDSIELLAMVNPDIVVIAHTATTDHLGRVGHDVARAAQHRRARADHRLWTTVDARLSDSRGPLSSTRSRSARLICEAGTLLREGFLPDGMRPGALRLLPHDRAARI